MSFDTHGGGVGEGRGGCGLWYVLYAAWVNNLTSCLKVPPAWVIFMLCMPPTRLCVCVCARVGASHTHQLFVNFACETAAARQLCKWQPSFLYTHMERAQVQANLEWVEEERGERERQTSRLTLNINLNLNRNQNEISTQSSCVLSIVVQYIIKSRGNYKNSKYF